MNQTNNLKIGILIISLVISQQTLLANNSIVLDSIQKSLTNSLFAEAQYGGPIANDDNASTDINTAVNIDVLDNDDLNGGVGPLSIDDGDCALTSFGGINTYADIDTNAANGNAVVIGTVPNHTITYTPNPGFTGSDSFTYQMCDIDSVEFSNIATVNITVNAAPNQAPTLNGQTITITKGDTQSFAPISGTDPDGNTPITYSTPTIDPLLGCSESATGTEGNIITCTPDNSITSGSYTFQITPTDSLGLDGSPATFQADVVDIPVTAQDPAIAIFKDKADGTVNVGDNIKIQLDVSNPNDFDLTDLTINANLDGTKVTPISGSVAEGQISGTKYSLLGVMANAQAFTSSSSSSSVTINLTQLNANQTRSFIFDTNALSTGTGDITSEIIISGSQVSTDQTNVPIGEPADNLVRTGGRILDISTWAMFIIAGFGILSSIGLHSKKSKSPKK